MSLRTILGAIGLGASLPFIIYLVYLSQAKTTSPDQIIFLAFVFSITFPTLILLSLVLFRSLIVLAVSLPVVTILVIMATGNHYALDAMAGALYLGVALLVWMLGPDRLSVHHRPVTVSRPPAGRR